MFSNTEAFLRLREQTQAVLDFTVLISNSVPLLKMTMKNIDKSVVGAKLANPDYFKGDQNLDQLKSFAVKYKENLSKYILLSNFSYFEVYVVDAIEEMFNFHGGTDQLIEDARKRCQKHVNPSDQSIIKNRSKLQDSYKNKNKEKYQKYTRLLQANNFKFPSELLSAYGVQKLSENLSNLKSVGIPELLIDGLHFPITDNEVVEFHKIRDIRNSIAHGKRKTFDVPSAMKHNNFLRGLSVRLDQHLVKNYFVIERFS
ncbi:MAG: hypothetical protein EOO52_01625 [Gammaproteobacteria bacterium]|nr:MAG: hypothetical protein EOO52_01625 [Gammaproteobacteria bacterium]